MHDAAIVRLSEMGVPLQMYSGVILTYLVSAAAVHRPEMDTVLITISLAALAVSHKSEPDTRPTPRRAKVAAASNGPLNAIPCDCKKCISAPGSTRPSLAKLFAHKPPLMSSVSPHFGKH